MVTKIARIYTLNDLTLKQLRLLTNVFKINGKVSEMGFSELVNAVQNSQEFKRRFGKYAADKVYHLCYSRNGNFVCTLGEFNKTNHQFLTPAVFQHGSINTPELKKQVLVQLAKFDDDNGEANLKWGELLPPQITDVAEQFGMSVSDESNGNLGELLTKTVKFMETFGKSKLEDIKFLFHLSDPLSFRTAFVPVEDSLSDVSLIEEDKVTDSTGTHNKDPTSSQNKDMGLKPGNSQEDCQVNAKTGSTQSITTGPKETHKDKKGKKGSLVKIFSISSVRDATIGQIEQIAELLGVELVNNDPVHVGQMREVLYDSPGFKMKFGDAETATLDDCYFCFGKNINLVCALCDFNESKHTFVIPRKFEHSFISTNDQRLAVLRQSARYGLNDLAHLNWEDLLLPQIWHIAKDYQVNMDQEVSDVSSWKQKIEKAALYKKAFGNAHVETLKFSFDRNVPYTCLKIMQKSKELNNGSGGLPLVDENNSTIGSNAGNVPEDISEVRRHTVGASVICVSELDGHQFIKLLDIFELNGKLLNDWDTNWNILQCSKYFLKKFQGYDADDVQVVWNDGNITNVRTADGSISMQQNRSLYPCVICCREVTDNQDETGQGLQCDRCNRFVHNNCMDKPVSKELYVALADSPEYVQIFCPDCMKTKGAIEKLSVDVDTIKKGMTEVSYASKVNSGLVQDVNKAVVSIESTAKTLPRRPKEDPAAISKQREEKLGRTIVVLKPKSHSNNSHEIRREFNRKFPEVALVAAVPTASGSIRMEFNDSTTKEGVAHKWDLGMFGGNAGVRTPTMKPTIGIIKEVNVSDNPDIIKNAVEEHYPGTVLDFFKRNDRYTGTVKLIFNDHNMYAKVMEEGGLKAGGVKYRMEQFHVRAKVIRCYKCQGYGHIATRCRAKEARCGKCCQTGHESNTCIAEITNPTCFHCKGSHFTGSKVCQEFKLVEEKINSQPKYGF